MAQAASISLSKFTATVQAAVKAAVQKHPKFKIDAPQGIALSYLIRGIPVPETILANVTIGETQAFANEVAAHISGAQPEILGGAIAAGPQGVIYSNGRHLIIGIPPLDPFLIER